MVSPAAALDLLDQAPGSGAIACAAAPGRVNLIGEHTDYNDGQVLPVAIDRHVVVAGRARSDRRVIAYTTACRETASGHLDNLAPSAGAEAPRWMAYVRGMAWALTRAGLTLPGVDLVIDADLPAGVGLSSSAALELAVARVWCALAGAPWDPAEAARLAQQAEHRFAGVECGIMDQMAVALARADSALLLDCRSLETELVRWPASASLIVIDTGVARALADAPYNARRQACRAALAAVREVHREVAVRALRDVTPRLLDQARHRMSPEAYRRACHVIAEMPRPAALAAALRTGDLPRAGALMSASHESLRTLFEASTPDIDRVVAVAGAHPACFGARLTGAGFGGCAVALVARRQVAAFVEDVGRALAPHAGSLFGCTPADGVALVDPRRSTATALPPRNG